MSNFKEIYPYKNFIENLHRMYSIGEDDYMTWAHNGKVEEAPLTSDYVYQLVKNTKEITGNPVIINDAINMPIESFVLHGNTTGDNNGSMSTPKNFKSVGIYNNTTAMYEIICNNDINPNLLENTKTLTSPINGNSIIQKDKFKDFSVRKLTYGGTEYANTISLSNLMVLEKSHKYTVSFYAKGNCTIICYLYPMACSHAINSTGHVGTSNDGNSQIKLTDKWTKYWVTWTTRSDIDTTAKSLIVGRIYNQGEGSECYVAGLKFEDGGVSTPWCPNIKDEGYQNNNQIIYSSQPLSKLQNKVEDYYKDGYVYLNTVYDTFRATDNWQYDSVFSNNKVTVISLFLPNAVDNSTDIWCSHFTPSNSLDVPNRVKIENKRVYISADANRYPDRDSILKWIKNNNITICYQRKNTIKEPVKPYVLLYTYDEYTKITNNQNALMDIEYRISPNARLWQRQSDGSFKEITS